VLIALATGARVAGDAIVVLLASTLLVGIGIAVAQTLLPSLVQEYFTDSTGLVTGLYTTALIAGAALSAGSTAPFSTATGFWTVGLAV
jgi:CP family cyanate transporter-like MFS transporter